MNADDGLVGFPAALGALHEGKVCVLDKPLECRDQLNVFFLFQRIVAQQRLCINLATLSAGFGERKDCAGTNLDLPLFTPAVAVALIVGLSARLPDFQQEAGVAAVKKVGFPMRFWTRSVFYKRFGKRDTRHTQTTPPYALAPEAKSYLLT